MSMLIALVLTVGLLTSCSSAPLTDVKNAPAPTTPVPVTETLPDAPVDYRVTVELWEDTVRADDGTELARYTFQLPVLSAYREDGSLIEEPQDASEERAAAAADAFNGQFSNWLE